MFQLVKKAFQDNFALLIAGGKKLYVSDVNRDELWDTYLNAFPEGEKQGHTCNSCKSFIRNYGNLVVINGSKMQGIWEGISTPDPMFDVVIKAMADKVAASNIKEVFVTKELKLGTAQNRAQAEDGSVTTWHHFALELPKAYKYTGSLSVEAVQGPLRDDRNVLKRSLDEISLDTVDTVLELIAQNSIYRGAEFTGLLTSFRTIKKSYDTLEEADKDLISWELAGSGGAVTRIRNTSIGTLLINISEGMELDRAVAAFESIMAPANYKRPTAIVTKRMVEDAEKKIAELGLTSSLGRKYATPDDISVNNVLFVDRDVKKNTGVFAELKDNAPVSPKSFSRVEEVSVDKFLKDILPLSDTIELFVENRHNPNFVTLIAPKDKEAPSLFKWKNGFSWSYQDGMADGLKEKVKAAGGKVDGYIRASLEWFNGDDLDLHVTGPLGTHIFFGSRVCPYTGGNLDVDMNAGGPSNAVNPVENIVFPVKNRVSEGEYTVYVHNFHKRSTANVGFNVELEIEGEVYTFEHPTALGNQSTSVAFKFTYSKLKGVVVTGGLSGTKVVSKNIWGIDTSKFHKVTSIMKSPNFWDGENIGNEHLFFIVDGVKTTGARGFFNEFLSDELLVHKRVFEAIGNKLKVEDSDKQMNGLGFSSTVQGDVYVRVTGKFSRIIKIKF